MHVIPDPQQRAVEQVAGFCSQMSPAWGLVNKLNYQHLVLFQIFSSKSGEPGRTRTSNPLIKSQLLYH